MAEKLQVSDKLKSTVNKLSGGERQRIAIIRSMVCDQKIILADEPTGNLDPETGSQIVALLQEISSRGTAVIMSTHNYSIVQAFPGKIMRCENASLLEM